jgi:hypothetical protein
MKTQADEIKSGQKLSSRFRTEAPNKFIENQTKKVPNLVFMGLAGVSILGSVAVALRAGKKTDGANFIGHWAPTFLLLGIYNKLIKIEEQLLDTDETERSLH